MSAHILTTFAAAFAALGVTVAAAQAQPPAPEMSVRVDVADLNMQSEAGARLTLQRIENAAAAICGREEDIRLLGRAAMQRACVRKTVQAAVGSVDSPRLTEASGRTSQHTVVASAR
jgi:UrcA family protein